MLCVSGAKRLTRKAYYRQRLASVDDPTAISMLSLLIENLESEKADLHPVDESKIYNIVPWQFAEHQTIKHSADEYARYPESKPVVTHE